MDDVTAAVLLAGKGLAEGTKLVMNGVGSIVRYLGGNTPDMRNQRRRGITEYKPSEMGGFFPPEELPEDTVISGGRREERAEAVEAFCLLSAYHRIPTVLLHISNQHLEQRMTDAFGNTGLLCQVNPLSPCYEPFFRKDKREIGQMILESAPKELEIKSSLRTYLDGALMYLEAKKIRPSYALLASCPHGQLFMKVDELIAQNRLSPGQGQIIKQKLMAGQNEYYKLENYFYDLDGQIGPILWKKNISGSLSPVSILDGISRWGILMLDLNAVSDQLLLNLMLAEIRLAVQRGIRLNLVLDSVELSDNDYLKRMIGQHSGRLSLAFSSQDVYAALNADDNLFHVLLGKSGKNIIFSHGSNVSAAKWAEGIGYYEKEEVSWSSQSSRSSQPLQLFPTTSKGQSTNITMKRDYIVRPEEILRMRQREVYIYSRDRNELAHSSLI